ncbi:conserved hypothetical protein [Vibrio coralliirubri]|uniref:Aminoglycoside N(3)-acetyltransferase n=1 Tax=Vibrio coralliirubri TaxID=1516159 RepID=A0AA86XF99_9VIBR|nr:AAC(3) family N-acetyltransferase [Vibrio coralliirubri]CDU10772.1 conserved hypothetical protein [Vibrio coralliirubri]
MRLILRKFLVQLVDDSTKKKLKKTEFRIKKKIVFLLPSLKEKKFKSILQKDLGLVRGDHLFVHASLSLINTKLSSLQVLDILLDIVGEKGSVTVPCYPPMSSKKFMLSRSKFNVLKTRSGMGELSEHVRKHPLSIRSLHPTKSIASIGLNREYLTYSVRDNFTAFGVGSPYEKMLDLTPKVLGVGVPMSYLSYVHCAEDMLDNEYPLNVNESDIYTKVCVDEVGQELEVKTKVHDMTVVANANPEKFVSKFLDRNHWKKRNWYMTPFFVVDAQKLTEEIRLQSIKGNTVYD